jgi:hypothetical protein
MPRTPVTVRLSAECWRFLQEIRADAPAALSDSVHGLLERTQLLHDALPNPSQPFFLDMLRMHAWELLGRLSSVYSAMPLDDPRRRLCEQCLDELGEAISRSRPT